MCEIFRGCYLYNLNPLEVIRLVSSLQLAVLYPKSLKVGEWKVEDVVKQGQHKIEFEKLLGYHQRNCAGLGSIKKLRYLQNKFMIIVSWCKKVFVE